MIGYLSDIMSVSIQIKAVASIVAASFFSEGIQDTPQYWPHPVLIIFSPDIFYFTHIILTRSLQKILLTLPQKRWAYLKMIGG